MTAENMNIMATAGRAAIDKTVSAAQLTVEDPYDMEVLVKCLYREVRLFVEDKIYEDFPYEYAMRLVSCSRVLTQNENFRYWSPADTIEDMPGDARVYLLYIPTYIATCALMHAYMKCPEEKKKIIEAPLYQAMTGCCGRGFTGHGYDCEQGVYDSMKIFETLGAMSFLKEYPGLNVKFTETFAEPYALYVTSLKEETESKYGEKNLLE